MKFLLANSFLLVSSFCLTTQGQERSLEMLLSEPDIPEETRMLVRFWSNDSDSLNYDKVVTLNSPGLQLQHKSVAQAPKDGCYYGIGNTANTYIPGGMSLEECKICEKTNGKIKKNESYVWGLTEGNGQIYFGVNTNYLCVAMADMTQGGLTSALPAYENECWACEYDKSQHKDEYGAMWGDWKAPRIYHYNPLTNQQDDVTPENDPNMQRIYGLRAAGSADNVSFIAGPNKGNKGITFIAYDNINNKCLGSVIFESLPGFDNFCPFNIRRSIVIDGVLYFGVIYRDLTTNKSNGALLRWYGDETDPFNFKVVGWMPEGASEFAVLKNRLYAGTWPVSICRSEEIPAEGFQPKTTIPSESDRWKTVFNYHSYEPDMRQSYITYCGGMTVYKDQIYFGTIHMTWGNHFIIPSLYNIDPMKNIFGYVNALFGSYRSSALFRLSAEEDITEQESGDDSFKIQEGCKIELLYGEKMLPAYDSQNKKWELRSTGWNPVFGRSGFNNPFINYIWSANVYDDKLFLGTMDFSNLIAPQLESMLNFISIPLPESLKDVLYGVIGKITPSGYELAYIDDPNKKATIISRDGYGNPAAYGIRNIINVGSKMYFGTANPLSLHEDGGWEIIEVQKGKPLSRPMVDWTPKSLKYGETIGENQLNAQVSEGSQLISGTYRYTYCLDEIPADTFFTPGQIALRMEFYPKDTANYAPLKTIRKIQVEKKHLNVMAPDAELEPGQQLSEDNYGLIYDGFVCDEDASVLKKRPEWKVEMSQDGLFGEYEINVSGGESDLYELLYHHGKLIIRVPSALVDSKNDDFRIYPVPAKDRLYFESDQPISKVVISGQDGRIALSVTDPGKSVNLSSLQPSLYLIQIHTEQGIISRKIFINN